MELLKNLDTFIYSKRDVLSILLQFKEETPSEFDNAVSFASELMAISEDAIMETISNMQNDSIHDYDHIIEVEWNGRIFVDEKRITKRQYNTFFDGGEYGIKLEEANTILKWQKAGKSNEVVPADELNKDAIRIIKKQALSNRKESGVIEIDGEKLHWNWDYEILVTFSDDTTVEKKFNDLDVVEKEEILKQMLDEECVWGILNL